MSHSPTHLILSWLLPLLHWLKSVSPKKLIKLLSLTEGLVKYIAFQHPNGTPAKMTLCGRYLTPQMRLR